MTSHCEPYSPVLTCSNTSATARSRSSREYFVLRAMIRFSTPVWSLHQTRGGSPIERMARENQTWGYQRG